MRVLVRLLAVLSDLPHTHPVRLRAETVIFDAMRSLHAAVKSRYS
jgi:hypothetical protein